MQAKLEEVGKAQDTQKAAQEEKLQKLDQEQQRQADGGAEELRAKLEELKKEQEKAWKDEMARAVIAEGELSKRLEAQQKEQVSAKTELQDTLQGLQKKHEDVAKEGDDRLAAKLEALRGEQEKAVEAVRSEVKAVETAQEKTTTELQAKVKEATEGTAKASEEKTEQQSGELAGLKGKLADLEKADAALGAEAKQLRQLMEQRQTEQSKVNKDVDVRQDASGDDIELLGQKLKELAAQIASGAEVEESVNRCLQDVADLQIRFEQERLDRLDAEGQKESLEDQLGHMVQTTAEIMGKFEDCATKEAMVELDAKVDGSFDSLLVRFETDRWVREGVDRVADTVSNQFLRLLDEASQKLDKRVDKMEQKVAALGG